MVQVDGRRTTRPAAAPSNPGSWGCLANYPRHKTAGEDSQLPRGVLGAGSGSVRVAGPAGGQSTPRRPSLLRTVPVIIPPACHPLSRAWMCSVAPLGAGRAYVPPAARGCLPVGCWPLLAAYDPPPPTLGGYVDRRPEMAHFCTNFLPRSGRHSPSVKLWLLCR